MSQDKVNLEVYPSHLDSSPNFDKLMNTEGSPIQISNTPNHIYSPESLAMNSTKSNPQNVNVSYNNTIFNIRDKEISPQNSSEVVSTIVNKELPDQTNQTTSDIIEV